MPRPPRHDRVDAAVLEVTGLVGEQGWLADRALERVLRRERTLYAPERRAVAEAVYGLLRARGQLAWLAAGLGGPLEPAAVYALWLVRVAGAAPEQAARRLGVPAQVLARALDRADARIAAIPDPLERLAVRESIPRWIAERFVAELGEEGAAALGHAMNRRAPLTLRANTLRGARDALRERLAEEGVAATPTRLSPWGLVLDGHANAFALAAFREGRFEIQDEGSQLIALAVGARPGETVVDACAGAGGKALALAAEMRGKGSLVALDVDAERLAEARRRARRAGVHNLRVRLLPEGGEVNGVLQDLAGRCQRVLIDAPCSGLGTLRRKPDARWRLTPDAPARFAALQRELAARFAPLVAPGGRLVYATCSIGRTENAEVAATLAALPGLAPLPLDRALGPALAAAVGATGNTVQLWPHLHGTDGFFIAAFERSRAP